MTRHLFVYGTLRAAARHPMHRVLELSASLVGGATVQARLYDLGSYPGIVPSGQPADLVAGELYEFFEATADEALRTLDDYEQVGPRFPEPHQYKRVILDVRLNTGAAVPAWAYVLTKEAPPHQRVPASDYLAWKSSQRSSSGAELPPLTNGRRSGHHKGQCGFPSARSFKPSTRCPRPCADRRWRR
jgi:gamma-glutamylcyclotransferase (GGCT)/AIG2-like uncharacterized protein YtfP